MVQGYKNKITNWHCWIVLHEQGLGPIFYWKAKPLYIAEGGGINGGQKISGIKGEGQDLLLGKKKSWPSIHTKESIPGVQTMA